MEHEYTDDAVRRRRLRSQRLEPRADEGRPASVVAGVGGLQAQDECAAALGVRARCGGATAADVEAARFEHRTIVRTWCMRGTLHLVAADDVPWLLSVFGPVFVHRGRRRLDDLGFDDEAAEAAVEAIREAVDDRGPLIRAEIATALQAAGFAFDPAGQAPYHLVRRAGLLGVVCEVAPKAGEPAYGRLDDWLGVDELPDREAGLETLARRYLSAHQPASLDEVAAWSGLPMADVRAGWAAVADETAAVAGLGRSLRLLAHDGSGPDERAVDGDATSPSLRLLPAYDGYLLGYADRDHAVAPDDESRIRPGGGVIRPIVVLDGRAVATWALDRSRKQARVVVAPFDALPADLEPRLRDEVADVGRFLETDLELQLEEG